MALSQMIVLDCTLRDGGYHNSWDFPLPVITRYLKAMKAAEVDVVELGFRFLSASGFKGPCAHMTDDFLRGLAIPEGLAVAVMVNGADLLTDIGMLPALEILFPEPAATSPVGIVRLACHFNEFASVLPAVDWLSARGFRVGFNLMQIADRGREEVHTLARQARAHPVEVLYFADSMGSMTPADSARITGWLREEWEGPIGIHTHDNMGLALANTLAAQAAGASWLDATVTGMGRGPGNARTEELVIEAEARRGRKANLVPLMGLIEDWFAPLKAQKGWGSNPYYYLTGKYGIHPTYVQEMLADTRFDAEDILAVIDHLRAEGGKKFSLNTLDGARTFYRGAPRGTWRPDSIMEGREVLILGTGPGVATHRDALERHIRRKRPLVLAMNTQTAIASDLIDLRVACHPVRLLADSEAHAALPQPIITPASMLPEALREALAGKELLDFGIGIEPDRFEFHPTHCIAPTSLVLAYTLAVVTSGKAGRILMAGFDGYAPGNPRNDETAAILDTFRAHAPVEPISVTPTRHRLRSISIYSPRV